MFGCTFEKLFLVALVASVVIGPQRLAQYARMLTDTVRSLRGFVEVTRSRAEDELGMPLTRAEWERLDLRQYDPRVIVREALEQPATAIAPSTHRSDESSSIQSAAGPAGQAPMEPVPQHIDEAMADAEPPASSPVDVSTLAVLDRIRPGQKYLTVGGLGAPAPDSPQLIAAGRSATNRGGTRTQHEDSSRRARLRWLV